jgi:signal transduction histidine kinase
MGGDVLLESELGAGARFTLVLPPKRMVETLASDAYAAA